MALELPPDPDAVPRTHLATIGELLSRYELGFTGDRSVSPLPNAPRADSDYYRIQTSAGPRVVRIRRKGQTRGAAEAEERVLAWAAEHEIPVARPLADSEGRTLHSLSGLLLSLEHSIEGTALEPAIATTEQWFALGATLGRIHTALAGYPGELPNGDDTAWDTVAAIDDLSRVDDLIRYYPSPGEAQLRVQAALRVQLELLESGAARPQSDFDELPRQPVHGGYRLESVLFDGESVVAVMGWNAAARRVAIHELARSIAVAGLTQSDMLDAYLRGYRSNHVIDRSQCGDGVELTWQVLLHDTHAYRARFIEGDRGANPLELAPIFEEWRSPTVRNKLAAKLVQFAT